jgi:hypothetical protein
MSTRVAAMSANGALLSDVAKATVDGPTTRAWPE